MNQNKDIFIHSVSLAHLWDEDRLSADNLFNLYDGYKNWCDKNEIQMLPAAPALIMGINGVTKHFYSEIRFKSSEDAMLFTISCL